MLDLDGRKKTLRQLTERIERRRTEVPEEGRGFHARAARLRTDIEGRLGTFTLTIKADEVRAFQERVETLEALAVGLIAVRAQARQLTAAEQALARGIARLDETDVKGWFAVRSERRGDLFATVGNDESDLAALDDTRGQLKSLEREQQSDRRVLELLDEAHRYLKTIRAPERIQALAGELPALRRDLLQDDQRLASIKRLLALLQPLRDFQTRTERPLQIDQMLDLVEELDEWIEVLRDGLQGQATLDMAAQKGLNDHDATLQELNARYNRLSVHWQDHEDTVFAQVLTQARELEARLRAQVQTEHAALTAELRRNRELFRQLADPGLTPGLAEDMDRLLSQIPDKPDDFGRWRDQCRHARNRFAGAIDADSYLIGPLCDQRDSAIRDRIKQIEALPLTASDRARCTRMHHTLGTISRPLAADARALDLLASLEALDALAEQAKTLFESALAKAQRLTRRRQGLCTRAERLQRIAADLGEPTTTPLPGPSDPVADKSADESLDLGAARRRLVADRRLLTEVQTELLRPGTTRLNTRLTRLAGLRALLDEDLDLPDDELRHLRPAAPGMRIKDLEALVATLPLLETRVQTAVQTQIVRLRGQRETLSTALADGDRQGLSRAECDALDQLCAALRDGEHDDATDPHLLVPSLRNLIAEAHHQLERVEGKHADIKALTLELHQRHQQLWDDYHDDEVGRKAMVKIADRIRALIQPVPGVVTSPPARKSQLHEAETLLDAVQTQARRSAAVQFAADLKAVRQLDDAPARDLARAIGDDPLVFPTFEQRKQVRALARRKRRDQ